MTASFLGLALVWAIYLDSLENLVFSNPVAIGPAQVYFPFKYSGIESEEGWA